MIPKHILEDAVEMLGSLSGKYCFPGAAEHVRRLNNIYEAIGKEIEQQERGTLSGSHEHKMNMISSQYGRAFADKISKQIDVIISQALEGKINDSAQETRNLASLLAGRTVSNKDGMVQISPERSKVEGGENGNYIGK